MAAWHYDLFLVSTDPIDAVTLIERLNREFAAMPSPSPKLLLWGSVDGDRIDFWTDHSPVQLLARFDLRAPSEDFRRLILKLVHDLPFRMVNADDIEVAPKEQALLADIESSSAAEFVRNPPSEEDEDEEEN